MILGIFIMFLRTSCIEKETENNEREREKNKNELYYFLSAIINILFLYQ